MLGCNSWVFVCGGTGSYQLDSIIKYVDAGNIIEQEKRQLFYKSHETISHNFISRSQLSHVR